MNTSETIAIYFSIGALMVSTISLLVSFRRYRIERAKFTIQQASEDVFIDVISLPCLYEHPALDVFICELSVSNRLPVEMIIREIGIQIWIKEFRLFGLFESRTIISLRANPTVGVANDVHQVRGTHVPLFDPQTIQAFVVDADTRKRLRLDDMERVPPSPDIRVWWLIVAFSHHKMSEFQQQGLELFKMNTYFGFHNGLIKNVLVRARVRSSLSDRLISKYALSSIIPDVTL